MFVADGVVVEFVVDVEVAVEFVVVAGGVVVEFVVVAGGVVGSINVLVFSSVAVEFSFSFWRNVASVVVTSSNVDAVVETSAVISKSVADASSADDAFVTSADDAVVTSADEVVDASSADADADVVVTSVEVAVVAVTTSSICFSSFLTEETLDVKSSFESAGLVWLKLSIKSCLRTSVQTVSISFTSGSSASRIFSTLFESSSTSTSPLLPLLLSMSSDANVC